MIIPEGMTEKEVLDIINSVANGLAPRYKFGYFDIEDIKQEAKIEALSALERFNPDLGVTLKTFLWTHVKNRLHNLKRNKFQRFDLPCKNCPLNAYDPNLNKSCSGCTKFEDKEDCTLYYNWTKRNNSKKNIMSPVGIDNIRDENENSMKIKYNIVDAIHERETLKRIDEKIPLSLRATWIKMKNGVKVSKADREKIKEAISEIINAS